MMMLNRLQCELQVIFFTGKQDRNTLCSNLELAVGDDVVDDVGVDG